MGINLFIFIELPFLFRRPTTLFGPNQPGILRALCLLIHAPTLRIGFCQVNREGGLFKSKLERRSVTAAVDAHERRYNLDSRPP